MIIKNLDKLAPSGTVRYTLTDVVAEGCEASLVLVMKHAGDGNPGWENANRKLAIQRGASSGRTGGEESIRALIPLFAKHVMVDWENATETYSIDAGAKLLTDLADNGGLDLVWGAMRYALEPQNFRGPSGDTGDLGNG